MAGEVASIIQATNTYELVAVPARELSFTRIWWSNTFGSRAFRSLAFSEAPKSMGLFSADVLVNYLRLLCAITDKASTGRHANATLMRLLQDLARARPDAKDELECMEESVTSVMKHIRAYRDKRVLHFDFETLRTGGIHLPPLLKDHFEAAAISIFQAMNRAEALLGKPKWVYEFSGLSNAEGELESLFRDKQRLRMLNRIAEDESFPAEVLRQLAKHRGKSSDAWILRKAGMAPDALNSYRDPIP